MDSPAPQKPKPKPKLIAIGNAYVDFNCLDYPFSQAGLTPNIETVGQDYEVVAGSAAINFSRLCAGLGLPVTFVGKVGTDRMADLLVDLLLEEGVSPTLIPDSTVSTNISLNFVNAKGDSIMAVAGTASRHLNPEEVRRKVAPEMIECTHLFLGGCFKLKKLLPAFADLVRMAATTDTAIIIDHGRLVAGITDAEKLQVQELVKDAQVYLPNADELQQLWEASSIDEGLKTLSKAAPDTLVVVKDADKGAVTMVDGKPVRVPAFPVRAINTVGAGDSFNAGFIVAQNDGKELLESIKFANATAALKISQLEKPTKQAVEEFLASH